MPAYDGQLKYDGGKPDQPKVNPAAYKRKLKYTEIITTPQIDKIIDQVAAQFQDGVAQIESMCMINNGVILAVIPDDIYPPFVIESALAIAFNQMSIRIILNNDHLIKSFRETLNKAMMQKPIPLPSGVPIEKQTQEGKAEEKTDSPTGIPNG